jgi:hypothetical protein
MHERPTTQKLLMVIKKLVVVNRKDKPVGEWNLECSGPP